MALREALNGRERDGRTLLWWRIARHHSRMHARAHKLAAALPRDHVLAFACCEWAQRLVWMTTLSAYSASLCFPYGMFPISSRSSRGSIR